MDGTYLFWVIVFGGLGIGFFSYGRKQKEIIPLLVGITLFIFPYFVTNLYLLVLAGAVLVALPYFIRT